MKTKEFIFDTLLDESDICNLEKEKSLIISGIEEKKKLVIYGPRNYGKTSLIKNVIIKWFKNKYKKHFVIFVDLMEVDSIDAINQRIQYAFEDAFSKSFPIKNLLQSAQKIIGNLKPSLTIDPITSNPSLSIEISNNKTPSFLTILNEINSNISKEMNCLIVMDEFQDISLINQAQGLFRQALQEIKNLPVILMGSKEHMLSELFAVPKAPLANLGLDINFEPIDYEIYTEYIQERFSGENININLENSIYLQDLMQRIPEAINMLCYEIKRFYKSKNIDKIIIHEAIEKLLEVRSSRFLFSLSHYSEKEKELLLAIAQTGIVTHLNSTAFTKNLSSSISGINKMAKKFLNSGIIEKNSTGYQITDPLLKMYLIKFY